MLKFISTLFKTNTGSDEVIADNNSLNKTTLELFNKNRTSGAKPIVCYAPFTNMYFDICGEVYACCISVKYFDKIKDKTIKQIWEGDKFNELRAHIKNNDLTFACNICNTYLKNNIFKLAIIKMFDDFSSKNTGYPKMMEFNLDNTCNLECIMCNNELSSSIRTNRDKLPPLPLHYDDNFVSQIEEFIPHLEKARFIGGEPFLINIYYKIWDKIIAINPNVILSVSTNGTILNSKIKDILNKVKFEIVFSIDSFNKQTYESIRVNAVFEKVIENLHYFKDYCAINNTNFNIAVCPLRQNWRELPDIVKYCNNINAIIFFNTVIKPFDCALWNLSSKELNEICTYLSNVILPETNNVERHNFNLYKDLINHIKVLKDKAVIRENFNIISDSNNTIKYKGNFINKLSDYLKTIDGISEENKAKNIDSCILRIDSLITSLPPDYNHEFLYSLIIDFDIKDIYNKLLIAETNALITDMKNIILQYYINSDL